MVDSFVYCWTDHKTQKLYVGVHKGSPTDGYVCSGKLMLEEYNQRSSDFTRQIIAGGTWKECLSLERAILCSVDACNNPNYYNLQNSNGKFNPYTPTEDTKQKISKSLKGFQVAEETKQKISKSHKGKPKSEETKRKMSEAAKNRSADHLRKINEAKFGRKMSEETKQKISETSKLRTLKRNERGRFVK